MSSMKFIPQDIIIYILHRLPTKSVARFRCVSKEWVSVLTDPRFIKTHHKTLDRNRFIFRSNDHGSLYSVPYNKHVGVSTLITKLDFGFYQIDHILGSVNGLVLASTYKNYNYVLLVCNLTTKEHVELPKSDQFSGMKGFGYDSVSDDYKVVIISKYGRNVYVYSLRTNTWKQMTRSSYNLNHKDWMSGVFVNGFLHWIFYSDYKPVIVAFSLADEKFSELPPPNLCNEAHIGSHSKLVVLGKKFAIFNKVKGDVWLMNEYGVQKSWTKIVVHGFNKIRLVRPKVFYDTGKILFLTSDLLWIYDVEERTFCKNVDISNMNINNFISAYAESLVSPKFIISK